MKIVAIKVKCYIGHNGEETETQNSRSRVHNITRNGPRTGPRIKSVQLFRVRKRIVQHNGTNSYSPAGQLFSEY